MAEAERSFDYVGLDASGRRVRASVAAPSEAAAYERLVRDGLMPMRIRPSAGAVRRRKGGARTLNDRDTAEVLTTLADLLGAGADIRSALGILGARSERPAMREVCRELTLRIGGGDAVDQAFGASLGHANAFVAALIAAGEAAGDLPGGLRRAGDLLEGRIKLREQLVSALSYPLFVLVSTIAAALMILLLVVPTLAPLVDDAGGERPLILGSLITVSDLLRAQMPVFLGLIGAMIAGLTAAGRAGLLAGPVDRFLHEGPPRKVMSALTFGGFAIALGGMLASGAPMTDALRLAIRGVNSEVSRRKLEPVATAVRQGHSLSVALQGVRGFPGAITRMAAVGEATGALGAMLARAGRLEEAGGLKRIDAVARLLGPALIVILGGLVGLLMAGLLSGVTELGQAALR